jgi:resuscitation-promoting factor RpfB
MPFLRKYAKYLLPAAGGIILLALAFVLLNPSTSTLRVYVDGQAQPLLIQSRSAIPAEFLLQAGVNLQAEDRILVNGMRAAMDKPIQDPARQTLQLIKAKQVNVTVDGQAMQFRSSAPTLGQALWEHAIILRAADALSLPLETPLTGDVTVTIRRSQPVRILSAGKETSLPTAAETVGTALAQVGVSLQNLDFSRPGENEPIPADRRIQVVRVSEEIRMQPTAIPYTSEYVADDQLGLDTQELVQAGEYGMRISRVRIRYEDGKEVQRTTEAEWISKAPVTQRYAYGTRANIQSLSTPYGPIEYYRAVSVWITCYHATGSPTASGKWPAYGDVAVRPEWYKALKYSRLYIPGYGIGTVTDVCPGCVGKYWIDVFDPTCTKQNGWHQTELIYFLTPIPANPLWVLP